MQNNDREILKREMWKAKHSRPFQQDVVKELLIRRPYYLTKIDPVHELDRSGLRAVAEDCFFGSAAALQAEILESFRLTVNFEFQPQYDLYDRIIGVFFLYGYLLEGREEMCVRDRIDCHFSVSEGRREFLFTELSRLTAKAVAKIDEQVNRRLVRRYFYDGIMHWLCVLDASSFCFKVTKRIGWNICAWAENNGAIPACRQLVVSLLQKGHGDAAYYLYRRLDRADADPAWRSALAEQCTADSYFPFALLAYRMKGMQGADLQEDFEAVTELQEAVLQYRPEVISRYFSDHDIFTVSETGKYFAYLTEFAKMIETIVGREGILRAYEYVREIPKNPFLWDNEDPERQEKYDNFTYFYESNTDWMRVLKDLESSEMRCWFFFNTHVHLFVDINEVINLADLYDPEEDRRVNEWLEQYRLTGKIVNYNINSNGSQKLQIAPDSAKWDYRSLIYNYHKEFYPSGPISSDSGDDEFDRKIRLRYARGGDKCAFHLFLLTDHGIVKLCAKDIQLLIGEEDFRIRQAGDNEKNLSLILQAADAETPAEQRRLMEQVGSFLEACFTQEQRWQIAQALLKMFSRYVNDLPSLTETLQFMHERCKEVNAFLYRPTQRRRAALLYKYFSIREKTAEARSAWETLRDSIYTDADREAVWYIYLNSMLKAFVDLSEVFSAAGDPPDMMLNDEVVFPGRLEKAAGKGPGGSGDWELDLSKRLKLPYFTDSRVSVLHPGRSWREGETFFAKVRQEEGRLTASDVKNGMTKGSPLVGLGRDIANSWLDDTDVEKFANAYARIISSAKIPDWETEKFCRQIFRRAKRQRFQTDVMWKLYRIVRDGNPFSDACVQTIVDGEIEYGDYDDDRKQVFSAVRSSVQRESLRIIKLYQDFLLRGFLSAEELENYFREAGKIGPEEHLVSRV